MGSLGGISSPTPPNGLNISCIAVPSSLVGTGSSSRAARRMSRASCSMEWPFSAARMRNRLFNPSSRLRTVILATMQPPILLSREYRMIAVQSLWLSSLDCVGWGQIRCRAPRTAAKPGSFAAVHGFWCRMQEVAHLRSFFSLRGPCVPAASSTRTVIRSVMRTGNTAPPGGLACPGPWAGGTGPLCAVWARRTAAVPDLCRSAAGPSSRTPSGPRTMTTSTHGGRQVCGSGAKVGITAARSITGWRLPPCNPGPRASSIPPVADMPHVQPDHQLPEGFRALAGGHVGRQGRGAEEPCLALPALDPKPDEGHQVAAAGTVAVPQRG